jgi:hypothetical protein
MYEFLTKNTLSEIKDTQYVLKKDISILYSNILQTEYNFQRKIDEMKVEFRNMLEKVRAEFYSVEDDQRELILNNRKDMKNLTRRRTDIKESYNLSLCVLEHCEKEVGVDLLNK